MTEKQLKWQKRSRILWRLNGMVGFPFEEGVLTSLEHEKLNVAFSIIRGVVQDSIEYKDSIVPLQESTDEDATTATYKKTYKFIGIW